MTGNSFLEEITMPHHHGTYSRIKISHPFQTLAEYEGSYDFFHSLAVTSYPDHGPWHKGLCIKKQSNVVFSEPPPP